MEKQILLETIKEAIESMSDGEAVALWNEYCSAYNRYDDCIEDMSLLPELFDTSDADGLMNMLNRFYFGHDENDENSSANPNRDWFYFNGYGNIVSTDYPKDRIDADEVAEYIVDNNNALYNGDIQDILDSAEEDEEEEED